MCRHSIVMGTYEGSSTMKWAIRSGFLALFAVLLSGSLKADTVFDYTLALGAYTSVPPPTDIIATFSLPEFPSSLPGFLGDPTDGLFAVTPLNLNIDGTPSSDFIAFFDMAGSGAMEDTTNPSAFNLQGPQLYAGDPDESNPEMVLPSTGYFSLSDFATGEIPYTLFVTETTTNTPEPGTLLLFGVGLTALLLIRKRYAVN